MFPYIELFSVPLLRKNKSMEAKAKFKIVYSEEADNFLNQLPPKSKRQNYLQHSKV